MEELFIDKVQIKHICVSGYKVMLKDGVIATHYNVILAYLKFGYRILFLNKEFANIFTKTDLKTIRSIDPSFKKRGDKFYSDNNKIKVVDFRFL